MKTYLIIGSGRAAQHFIHYFRLLGLPFQTWNRKENRDNLQGLLQNASHILLLISDSALESFFREHAKPGDKHKIWIHFSGALEIPDMISAHPLMTFGPELYDLSTYKEIPFVLTSTLPWNEILPDLPNRHDRINAKDKALYHAYCVASGNFTTLLWQKMKEGMASMGLPEFIHEPYMKKTFENLLTSPGQALTGPIARRDRKTIHVNYEALKKANDPFEKIYRAFSEVYFPESFEHASQAGEK